MAITNAKKVNGTYAEVVAPVLIGDGVPADTDDIVVKVKVYPVGTEYTDLTNNKLWKRTAANGVAADFVGVALT